MASLIPIRILGTGAYLPQKRLTNDDLARSLDTSDEWIVTRTGIKERRLIADDEATSDLAVRAAAQALEDARITAADLDVILCATASGDYPLPSTASLIQRELGATGAGAMDVAAACAGYLYGMTTGAGLIQTGFYDRVLVVGAEALTRQTDYQDRTTAILFGDGAGAAVLGRAENGESGILYSHLGCDGTRTKDIWIPAGGSRLPTSQTTVAERLHFMKMRGREVYKFAVNRLQIMIQDALRTTGIDADELKMVIPHQSNLRIIESVREKLGLPLEKIMINIHRCGNTSSASIAMGLDEARRTGRITPGDLVLMTAIGAGLAWGAMILRL